MGFNSGFKGLNPHGLLIYQTEKLLRFKI